MADTPLSRPAHIPSSASSPAETRAREGRRGAGLERGPVPLVGHLDEAIRRAAACLRSVQQPDGHWVAELEANVTITAEYIFFHYLLGTGDPDRLRKAATHIQRKQRPDGTWPIYYGGPGDISTTAEAYAALKMMGHAPDAPYMRRAREFVLARGGLERTRVFTKIWMALVGESPWSACPEMPPELLLFPPWCGVSIYEFSSWSRSIIVPLTVLQAIKPVTPLPPEARVRELYRDPMSAPAVRVPWLPGRLSWRHVFIALDRLLKTHERLPWKPLRSRALRRAEEWLLSHQEPTGDWAGIIPAMVNSTLALYYLGYPVDHPRVVAGRASVERFTMERDDDLVLQSCVSPVWDTALAAKALLDSDAPPDDPALQEATRWLLAKQVFRKGDWAVKNRTGEPGGWAFEYQNDLFPDADDSALVLLVLAQVALPKRDALAEAIRKGLAWTLSMQCRDGGWGAFDVNNNLRLLNAIPFADHEALIDPSTPDLTGHVMELVGYLKVGDPETVERMHRALEYLKRTQEPEGAWWGRWGVNYIYGTSSVLCGLEALGEEMAAPWVRRGVEWLLRHQNADGGWGESCRSYEDPAFRGVGESTASQTAWAIQGLLAAGEVASPAVLRGITFLLDRQRPDGQWDEEHFTGTGFPKHFKIKYHLYRNYFPLAALGAYRRRVRGRGGTAS